MKGAKWTSFEDSDCLHETLKHTRILFAHILIKTILFLLFHEFIFEQKIATIDILVPIVKFVDNGQK